MPVVSAVILWC